LGRSKAKTHVKESFRSNFKLSGDRTKFAEVDKQKLQPLSPDADDKLTTLKNFRKKNGLCFKCGNKWAKDHKCPQHVPLHVIEELLDALEATDSDEGCEESDSKEIIMTVNQQNSDVSQKRRTMRLCGQIGKLPVLILVDSGSVGTFISSDLAKQLPHTLTTCAPAQFVTTDGSPMTCNQKIQGLHWMCQGHTFVSDAGVLPLRCFDMILGQDWLESASPMWVHWSNKLMKFTHEGKMIKL
jgi:hypothetical protein